MVHHFVRMMRIVFFNWFKLTFGCELRMVKRNQCQMSADPSCWLLTVFVSASEQAPRGVLVYSLTTPRGGISEIVEGGRVTAVRRR